jgi:hypothetical protein
MVDIKSYFKHINAAAIYLAPIACLLLLGLVLNMTNPLNAGPGSILVVFMLLYFLIVCALSAVLYFVGTVWRMLKPHNAPALRRGYYVLSIVSLAPVLFVALNTLGQLEILEVILILLLVGLGCFYVLRRSAK